MLHVFSYVWYFVMHLYFFHDQELKLHATMPDHFLLLCYYLHV